MGLCHMYSLSTADQASMCARSWKDRPIVERISVGLSFCERRTS